MRRNVLALLLTLASTPFNSPRAAAGHEIVDLRGDYRPGAVAEPFSSWSDDGEWLLFRACEAGDCWVASAARNPHPVRELAGPLGEETGGPSFVQEIADSGRRALYVATSSDPEDPRELWSRPIDGGEPPVRLHPALPDGHRVIQRILSSDGRYVAFRVDADGQADHLGIAAVDGSFVDYPVDSGIDLDDDRTVFSPAGDRLVYWLDTDSDGVSELRTVTVPGGEPQPLANVNATTGTDSSDPVFSLDGERVLFSIDSSGHDVLVSVDIADDSFDLLLGPESAGQEIVRFAVAPGGWVLFVSDFDTPDQFELWTVPDDDSFPPQRIHEGLVPGGDVSGLSFRIAGDHVVYLADAAVNEKDELWSASVSGFGTPTRRSAPLGADRDVSDLAVSDDGVFLVYRADGETDERLDLYRARVQGLNSIERLSNVELFPPEPYAVGAFDIAPDSMRVAFAAIDSTAGARLLEQPLDDPTVAPPEIADLFDLDRFHYLGDSAGVAFEGRPTLLDPLGWYLADTRIFGDGFELGHADAWTP